jgi:hypothetical protein
MRIREILCIVVFVIFCFDAGAGTDVAAPEQRRNFLILSYLIFIYSHSLIYITGH